MTIRNKPEGQSGLIIPPVIRATDQASAIAAVNQMRNIISMLSKQLPPENNVRRDTQVAQTAISTREGGPSPQRRNISYVGRTLGRQTAHLRYQYSQDEEDTKQPEWEEIDRITQRVRIHNPDDDEQWVEVERIMKVKFRNTITGALLVWRYKPL